MGKVLKSFTILISIILILGAVGVALLALPFFGNQALIVRSGSMEPTIGVGSVVIVRQPVVDHYNIGDIISFKFDQNTIITHRIIEVKNSKGNYSYITKGDANEEADNWVVKHDNVIGSTYVAIPEVGRVLSFARSEYGFPALIILPALLVILAEIINIIREIKKTKKRSRENVAQEKEINANYPTAFTKKNFGLVKVVALFFVTGLFMQSTAAFFSDTVTSKDNYFAAAAEFPTTPTPTLSITPTPTATPTPTTTPTPTPPNAACSGSIIISGNGAFSYNKAYLECIKKKIIEQNNTTVINTQVNTQTNTGGNTSGGNTTSTTTTTTGEATSDTTVIVEGSTNTSN